MDYYFVEEPEDCMVRLATAGTMAEIAEAKEKAGEVLLGALGLQPRLLAVRGRWESELPPNLTKRRTVARWAAEQTGLAAVLDIAKGAAECLLAGVNDPSRWPEETLADIHPLRAG